MSEGALDPAVTDVYRTLAYSKRKLYRQWLIWLGLPALAAGGVLMYIGDFTALDWAMTIIAIGVGVVITLFCIYRLIVPGKAALLLSPQGIRLHFDLLKDIVIPWRAVEGVDTVDITGEFRGTPVRFSGVTV